MTQAQRQHRFAVILAFALVYFFWGSTYLGIDIAVEHIPPALMCGIRFLIAGVFMLAFCGLRGRKIHYQPQQLGQMAMVGVLLLMGGNLTPAYAEKHVASGLAALIIAVTPLWFLVLDSLLLGDHHIALRGKIGLGLGVAGLLVLLWPDLAATANPGASSVVGFDQPAGWLIQLGAGIGAGEEVEVTGCRSVLGHSLADDRRGRSKPSGRLRLARPLAKRFGPCAELAQCSTLWFSDPGWDTPPTSGCWAMCRPRKFRPTRTSIRWLRCFWAGWFCTNE